MVTCNQPAPHAFPAVRNLARAGTAGWLLALARMSADVDTAKHLSSLFATLEDALRSFSLHKALHACDQILAVAPEDEDALRAKVAVCIHSESFDAALSLLSAHPELAARLPFEKAYCLYRASRHKEALELLRDAEAAIPPEHAAGVLQLRAQLQYRAGAFDDCIRTYELAFEVRRRRCGALRVPASAHPCLPPGVCQAGQLASAESRANVVAAYISAGRARDVPELLTSLGLSADECFEAAYNVGCAKLAQGQLSEAHDLLLLSNRMGREALLDEEYAEEDIEKELLPSAWQGLRRRPSPLVVADALRPQSWCSSPTWQCCKDAKRRRWRRTRTCSSSSRPTLFQQPSLPTTSWRRAERTSCSMASSGWTRCWSGAAPEQGERLTGLVSQPNASEACGHHAASNSPLRLSSGCRMSRSKSFASIVPRSCCTRTRFVCLSLRSGTRWTDT